MTIDRIRFHRTASPSPAEPSVAIEGKATPGAEVVVENRSAAPWGPSSEESTFTRTRAGPDGRFQVQIAAAREGDYVRIEANGPAGVSALTARIQGTAPADGRRPEISQQSFRLVEAGPDVSGTVDDGERLYALRNVSKNPRFGEPHLAIDVVNRRTGEHTPVVLDEEGQLPLRLTLTGKPGDTFALLASDGRHEDSGDEIGRLTAPSSSEEPSLSLRGAGSVKLTGPLVEGGIGPDDPVQGSQIGDCYLVAGASAVAELLPGALADMMRELPDGRVAFTFQAWNEKIGRYEPEEVVVTREVPTKYGRPCMGVCRGAAASTGEAWWPLLEKAYAKWKGSYEAMGSGYPYEVFEALLGREGRHFDTAVLDEAALHREVERALHAREPMVVWTHPDSTARPFLGKGLVADHAYSLHDVKVEAGEVMLKLRNPWGRKEPGSDGNDDGVFWLPAKSFLTYFCGLGIARA